MQMRKELNTGVLYCHTNFDAQIIIELERKTRVRNLEFRICKTYFIYLPLQQFLDFIWVKHNVCNLMLFSYLNASADLLRSQFRNVQPLHNWSNHPLDLLRPSNFCHMFITHLIVLGLWNVHIHPYSHDYVSLPLRWASRKGSDSLTWTFESSITGHLYGLSIFEGL